MIPLANGQPAATGRTDTERLLAGELIYSGIERTPVCAVAHETPYRGHDCPLASELFATMLDVYLVLGDIAEMPESTDTADGRPATRAAAVARLARCLCADTEEFIPADAFVMAEHLAARQAELLGRAVNRVARRLSVARLRRTILSGHGEPLFRRAGALFSFTGETLRLADQIGAAAARCGPAYALARIAAERWDSA